MDDGSKKLLNNPDNCVDECLAGVAAAYPCLALHGQRRVVLDAGPSEARKVGVLSGGGSGHEPFPAGYVGSGMLTAAVCGSVFASPPSSNILYAIRVTAGVSPGGVLVLIPNYTGDILNFGLAVELAKSEGLKVDSLVVGDDIAQIAQGGDARVGRRGMVGIVAVFKAAGSAAQRGASLDEVRKVAQTIMEDVATLGLALGGGTLPGASAPLFSLSHDEMELGVGVHGEAGIRRLKLQSAQEVVSLCLDHLVSFLSLKTGSKVVVLINNLGGLSQLEQWVVTGEVQKQLTASGVTVVRIYAAPLFTSIDMPGVQICLLKISPEREKSYLTALDDETTAPAWPGRLYSIPSDSLNRITTNEQDSPPTFRERGQPVCSKTAALIKKCLASVTAALRSNEEKLNLLDSGCGDGDCGTTLRHLADGIEQKMTIGELNFEYPATLAAQLAAVAASTMGGTSGAIYSLFLTHAGDAIVNNSNLLIPKTWGVIWRAGLLGVQKYSRARVGDRTMFDSLEPALQEFEENINSLTGIIALEKAVVAAVEGCERTRTLVARAGRASYVEATRVTDEDAGAFGVTVWLSAVLEALH